MLLGAMHISLLPARASTKETQERKAQNKKGYQSSWTHSKGVVKVTVGQVQEKGHPPKPPTKLDQNLSVFFFQNPKLGVPLCGRSVVAKFLASHPTPWQQWTVVLMVSRWCSEGEPSLPTIFVKLASESRYSSMSPCGGNAQARWLLERLYKQPLCAPRITEGVQNDCDFFLLPLALLPGLPKYPKRI